MATRHKEATQILMDLFKGVGLDAYIGKVNMDRNAPEDLVQDTEVSIEETRQLVEANPHHPLVNYMVFPRYVICTTIKLMEQLGELAEALDLPMHSHLCTGYERTPYLYNQCL